MKNSNQFCSLDTVQEYTKNILYTYHYANNTSTAEIVNDGATWYKDAHKLVYDIAQDLRLNINVVAGVFAVMSPNQNWNLQVRDTRKFIEDILSGIDYKHTGYGYYANRLKARNIILNNKVFPYLSGVKVTAFYYNIMGKYDIPTIDLWAIRIALKDYKLDRTGTGKYMRNYHKRDEIVKAYMLAAKKLNLPVAVLQSVTWVIARENKEIK